MGMHGTKAKQFLSLHKNKTIYRKISLWIKATQASIKRRGYSLIISAIPS